MRVRRSNSSSVQGRRGWRAFTVAPVIALWAFSCDGPRGGRVGAEQEPAPCYIPHVPRRAACLTLQVPQDWANPDGPRVAITAIRIPATHARGKAPLYVLPGGPGQGASAYGGLVASAFAHVNRTRDLVMIDPRGTGRSTPFRCPPESSIQGSLSGAERSAYGAACARRAPAPPQYFTAREVIADLERMRQAFGDARVTLWGGSWGTRLVQFYAAAHPSVIDAVVLDGAVPVDTPLVSVAPTLAARAWEAMRRRCRADVECRMVHEAGLDTTELWLKAYRGGIIPGASPTARGGEWIMSRDDLLETVRGALYQPSQAAALPYVLRELRRGNGAPLVALSEGTRRAIVGQEMGAMLAVMCSEEASQLPPGTSLIADALFGDAYARTFQEFCSGFPAGALPREMYRPAIVPVPALVLSGAADPVSPPSQGVLAAAHFQPSQHVVVPHGGHISSRTACLPEVIAAFLDDPLRPAGASCLGNLKPAAFVLSSAGPVRLP